MCKDICPAAAIEKGGDAGRDIKMNKSITAQEARELQSGSMKRKGYFFRMRLAFICGQLNSNIEMCAEYGNYSAHVRASKSTARKYYPLMAQIYEKLGYYVLYKDSQYSYNDFYVCWDPDKISDRVKGQYDYHTDHAKAEPAAAKEKPARKRTVKTL